MSKSLRPHGLQPSRLQCLWASPGKNTGVACHAPLQGVFSTQGLNPHLSCLTCVGIFLTRIEPHLLSNLHGQAGSLPLAPPGKPIHGHLGCFCLLATVNNAGLNMSVQVSLKSLLSILLSVYPAV